MTSKRLKCEEPITIWKVEVFKDTDEEFGYPNNLCSRSKMFRHKADALCYEKELIYERVKLFIENETIDSLIKYIDMDSIIDLWPCGNVY